MIRSNTKSLKTPKQLSSRSLLWLLLAGLAFTATGCATSGPTHEDPDDKSGGTITARRGEDKAKPAPRLGEAQASTTEATSEIKADLIAPGFEIQLKNATDKNLNGKFRVDADHQLKVPYNVVVNTDGLSLEELRWKLTVAYRPYFKLTPRIEISISDRMYWVEVRGLVEKPGRYLMRDNASLEEALSMAGGPLKASELKGNEAKYVKIDQLGSPSLSLNLSEYFRGGSASTKIPHWKGGDLITLMSDRDESGSKAALLDVDTVQILGEIRTPGEYRLKKAESFFYYLAKAGGPTERAKLSKIEIIRNSGGSRISQTFDLDDTSEVPALQGGDLVIVHAEKPTSFEKGVSTAAGLAGILNAVLLIVLLL